MRNEKELVLTWDAVAVQASLPRDTAFTFMDLLAMKGQAPVIVEETLHLSTVIETAVEKATETVRQSVGAVTAFVAAIGTPAFDFMSLLTAEGHVPVAAQNTIGKRRGFGRLISGIGAAVYSGLANDDWKAPANSNEVQKVA